MVLLCFMLDLRTISLPLLRELKQCLLQLANLYAISSCRRDKQSETLSDRIGLCYIQRNKISCSDELRIGYAPRGSFNLRDFHHAVNNMPTDGLLPEMIGPGATKISGADVTLTKLLSEEVLYSWGSKDIVRKVIFISSCLLENIESLRKILLDAADRCISMEFILLEQDAGRPNNASQEVQEFINSISDLENCSLRTHLPDTWVLHVFVKRWLQELKDNLEEPLRAIFLFKSELAGSTNQICCNLSTSVIQIIDSFSLCRTCRCHGLPLDDSDGNKRRRTSTCPVTWEELETSNLVENAVKVGESTLLFLPSFQSFPEFDKVSAPIRFSVIERTNLASLSESTILGTPYIVTPLTSHDDEATSDECDKTELNIQLFKGLCQALHFLDQGLVCSSNCNIETMREGTLRCFYVLQPSDKGPMLLRKLAGSEEILPFPDAIRSVTSEIPGEIQASIQTSLSQMELRDYNPLLHQRGFHPKLNLLVKESLHFGAIPQKRKETSSKTESPKALPVEMTILPVLSKEVVEIEDLTQAMEEDKTDASLADEWEQLIVNEECKIYSPTCVSIPKTKISILSPPDVNKQLIEKTSRILERLEAPRQLKTKGSSPMLISSNPIDPCMPRKKPLVPFGPIHATDSGPTLSQPLRPNFQRLKRKQR